MIVSHDNRVIFVKTRKTAGTSIEMALRAHATRPDDVVTPVTAADELVAPVDSPPRNCEVIVVPPYRWGRRELSMIKHQKLPRRRRFENHDSAAYIRRALPREWNEYSTFANVRNPWDYAVSLYFWERHRRGGAVDVDDLLDRWPANSNWRQITIGGTVAVDQVVRFESLREGLARVSEQLGIPDVGQELPKLKAHTGRNGLHYRDVLEDRHVERIASECAPEIEAFGYTQD